MKDQITKRQHVVNRKYLTKWEDVEKKVFCLDTNGHIFAANPTKLCVERYFYEIESINHMEKDFILTSIGEGGRDQLIANNNDCLNTNNVIDYMIKLKEKNYKESLLKLIDGVLFRALSKNIIDLNRDLFPQTFNQQYSDLMKEGVEQEESYFEGLGYPFFEMVNNHDYEKLDSCLPDFIEYICVQYYRTSTMKQKMVSIDPSKIDLKKIWSVFHLALAVKTADYLLGRQLTVIILENTSNLLFITGDQPVINIKAGVDGEETKDLEFYYPISPRLAIKIVPVKGSRKISYLIQEISSEEIHTFNMLMKQFSKCLYANNIGDLLPYK